MTRLVAGCLSFCSHAACCGPESGFGAGCDRAPVRRNLGRSPQKSEFQKIEDAWSTAINLRDQYGLELVLSPLFVDVSAGGDITTRNQQLAQRLPRGQNPPS